MEIEYGYRKYQVLKIRSLKRLEVDKYDRRSR